MASFSTTWGSAPAIPIKVDFESSLVRITLGAVQGNSYFGFPVYADLYRNSSLYASGCQIKAATPNQWNQIIAPINPASGITRVRIWASGNGVTRGAINIYSNGTVTNESGTSGGGSSGGDTGGDSGGGSSGGGSDTGSAGSTITSDSFSLSCGNITLGVGNTLTVIRPTAAYTPTFTYSFGSVSSSFSPTLVSSGSTKLVYSWSPDASLAAQIPNSLTGSGTITMKIGGYTKNYSFVAYVPESMTPTASLAVDVVNENPAVTVCAKGLSKVHYAATAAGVYGSTITGYEFAFAGQTVSGREGTTGLLTSSGLLTPIVTVTDSRGRRATAAANTITVYDYNIPIIRSSFAWRCNADGTENEAGAYLRAQCTAECSDLNGTNGLTIWVRYKPTSGEYGGYVALENGIAKQIGSGLEADKTYTVEIVATDTVGNSKTVEYTSSTSAVTLHLRKGGIGAAFGKYAESETLECAWDANFLGNAEVQGDFAVGGNLSIGDLTIGGKSMLDLTYPVGSIYISVASTNPGTLFGGTWEALGGRFLLGADGEYAAGITAGRASVTLTEQEMPSHTHKPTVSCGETCDYHTHDVGADKDGGAGSVNWSVHSTGISGSGYQISTSPNYEYHTHDVSVTIASAGQGQSFSIMPPYLAVYMWKRTR